VTLGAILTAIAQETLKGGSLPATNDTSSMDTTTRARFLNAVNRRYRSILSRPAAVHLRESTTTFTTVAGTALYALSGVAKLHRVFEATNDRRLEPMTLDQYRSVEPDPDSHQGTPTHFVNAGFNASRVPQIYLWRTPSDAIPYTCDVLSTITDLSLDADIPQLPEDFHDILVLAGLVEEYRRLDDPRLGVVNMDLKEREGDLAYWLAETASGSSNLMADPPSRLGAWFPSGT
jgi:hypothetical protein